MHLQRNQRVLLILLGALLLGVTAFAVFARRSAPDGSQTAQPSVLPPSIHAPVDVPTSLPPIPTTLSGDLASTAADEIDHRLTQASPSANALIPKLAFTYTLASRLPVPSITRAPVYLLRDVDAGYATALASAFGFTATAPLIKGTTYVFTGDLLTQGGYLTVHGRSGYASYRMIAPSTGEVRVRSAAKAREIATAELSRLGLLPEPAESATYQRASTPGMYYVEYHRPWKPLPILEVRGALSLDAAGRAQHRPDDADIIATSDRANGLARANDFNTITVVVSPQGRVVEITANMRPLERMLAERPLKTPEHAWKELQEGNGVLGLALPIDLAMGGKTWEQVFPHGVATSSAATVRTIQLAYIEKSSTERQRYLQPAYLFAGDAQLETGIRVDFIVAVAAVPDTDDALPL